MDDFEFPEMPHVYLPAVNADEGLTRWEFLPGALDEFQKLESIDEDAFLEMQQLLLRWGERGAREDDVALVEPSGRRVLNEILNPPWLGELKGWGTGENGEDRHFRLYFLDISLRPGEPAHQMLVSLCKEKRIFDDTRQGARKTNEAQDRDFLLAMRLGKKWCQKNRVAFRPWPPK